MPQKTLGPSCPYGRVAIWQSSRATRTRSRMLRLPLAKAGSPSSSVSVKEPVIKLKEQTLVHDERIEDGREGVEVISATTSEQCLQDNNNLNDEQVQPKKNKAKRKQLLPAGPAGQMLEPPLMPYGAPFWPMHMNLPVGDGYMMPYASPFPYPMMPDLYNDPHSYSGMGPPAYPTQRQDDRSESRERRMSELITDRTRSGGERTRMATGTLRTTTGRAAAAASIPPRTIAGIGMSITLRLARRGTENGITRTITGGGSMSLIAGECPMSIGGITRMIGDGSGMIMSEITIGITRRTSVGVSEG